MPARLTLAMPVAQTRSLIATTMMPAHKTFATMAFADIQTSAIRVRWK